jgi:ribulose-5-phosphate 4-epimerase/fuculose-1-phosphate aldolase
MTASASQLSELRETVARSCRIIGMLDLSNPTQGHVSVRIPGEDKVLIRARGPMEAGLYYTTAGEVITVDFDGKLLSGSQGLAVPQEVFIHTEMYRARPEINSVIHIHPSTVVLFTICDVPLLPILGSYNPSALDLLINDRISQYDRSILIRDSGLGRELAAAVGKADVCMMRSHGITSVGRDVQEATINAINLFDLAKMNYQARLLGTPRPIRDDDLAVFRGMRPKELPTPEKPGKPSDMVYSLWRFYSRQLDDRQR